MVDTSATQTDVVSDTIQTHTELRVVEALAVNGSTDTDELKEELGLSETSLNRARRSLRRRNMLHETPSGRVQDSEPVRLALPHAVSDQFVELAHAVGSHTEQTEPGSDVDVTSYSSAGVEQ
jgi:hypothetical protein